MSKMYLKHFNRRSEYNRFDSSDGSFSEFREIIDEETSGFCKNIDNRWIAVYPDADKKSLIVYIDGVTWNLYGETTCLTYEHKYDQDKTYFKIEDDDNRFEMTYDAWWKGVPHLKPSEWLTFEEQDNKIEDFFGYIKYLSMNEEDKENWIESWTENSDE